MSSRIAGIMEPNSFRFHRSEALNRPERIVLMVLVGGTVILDIVGMLGSNEVVHLHIGLGIVTTLTFALYIWSPVIATAALGVAIAFTFLADNAIGTLLAGSIAALLVLRLGTSLLIVGYVGGLLVSTALLATGYGTGTNVPANVAVYLIVATVAGTVGLALRMAYARGHRLEHELAGRAEREREAILAERRWIAGELHDSIAHHLTIVALHVQLLDDEAVRPRSQEAIRIAAKKALSDLRFVIELADDTTDVVGVASGDLAEAIDEATREIEAAGHRVVHQGNPADESIPRGVEIILTRIIRESATNILKYAGDGEVHFALDICVSSITLTIRSPLPITPRRELSSTGTGLNRMAERVLGVKGEFSAGPVDDCWQVTACLPVAGVAKPSASTS